MLRARRQVSKNATTTVEEQRARVTEAAWTLLAYRARSRGELRQRLLHRGFAADVVDAELDRLVARGYVDDAAFAQSLVALRQSGTAARGTLALRQELRQRGLSAEVVNAGLALADDPRAAEQAADRRSRGLAGLAYPDFHRRLLAFLQRRGFAYEVAQPTVDAAWKRLHTAIPDHEVE